MNNSKSDFKNKTKETFNNQANIYDSTYNGKHAKRLYDSVIEEVYKLSCTNVLDIGCGTGTILSMLSVNSSLRLFGLDLSEAMISVAKEKLQGNAELKVGDSEHLPWEDSYFDVIVCTDSFHHYTEPTKVLRQMSRVLRSNGILIIGDPWMISPLRQIGNMTLRYSKEGDYRIYSKKEISSLLIECGFETIEWRLVNSTAFLLTAKNIKH